MDANSVHTHGNTTPPPVEPPKPEAEETSTAAPEAATQTPEAPRAEPATQPEPTPQPKNDNHEPQTSSAGVTVLQWLTYAFWGWLAASLLWLMGTVLSSAILNETTNESTPYAIAAAVVLLPLAFVCDLLYRKHEPAKKAGGAMVIMVVHAVLFALISIVSLIIAVFITVNGLVEVDSGDDERLVGILTALTATVLFAGAFVRALNPLKGKKPARIYALAMLGVTLLLLALTIAGPLVKSIATRGDRIIEQALPSVQSSIEAYINDNSKLPASLKDVSFTDEDAQELVEDGKVEYIPEEKTGVSILDINNPEVATKEDDLNLQKTFRYQLCVEYQAASGNKGRSGYYADEMNGYKSYISTYSHDAGRTCYKLKQTVY